MEQENMMHPDYRGEILALVQSNLAPARLAERLRDYHESDVAEALEQMQVEERKRVYAALRVEELAGILEYAPAFLGELGIRKRVEVLACVEPATAVVYLEELQKSERTTVMELLPEEAGREISLLASFDKDEIGSKMTTNYIAIHSDLQVPEAMRELIRQAEENDNVSTLYVLDEADCFVGAIDLKDLIIARAGKPLENIVMSAYPYVYADELIEDCIIKKIPHSEFHKTITLPSGSVIV